MPEIARSNGRFVKGHSGNPTGRPKQILLDYQRTLEQVVREHITVAKVKRILNKLVEQAENGDVKAAKLIMDKLIPNAAPDVGDQDAGRTVVFRIENATFAATAQHSAPALPAIEAEVVQLSPPNPQQDVEIPVSQESND